MERLGLRIATVAALQNGGHEPMPTLAGSNIFDSLNAAANDLGADDRAPIIIVRTEDDASRFDRSGTFGGRGIDLTMLFAICHGGTGTLLEGIADTDSNAEAMLDLMEYQAKAVLKGFGDWGRWWQRPRGGYAFTSWNSAGVWPTPRTSLVRLAARLVTVNCMVNDDCLPGMVRRGALPKDEGGAAILPTADLPAPLKDIFDHISIAAVGNVKLWAAEVRAALENEQLPNTIVADDLLSVRAKWLNRTPPPSGEAAETLVEANLLADQD